MIAYNSLKQIVAPLTEVVSLAEARDFAKIDDELEDAIVGGLIRSARETCETFTARQFIIARWRLKMDAFPYTDSIIEMPKPPLTTSVGEVSNYVASIQYYDPAGAFLTHSSTLYTADTDSDPGRLYPIVGQNWPATRTHPDSVWITFHAGYGYSPSNVPETIRLAVKQLVAHWYNNREAFGPIPTGGSLPHDVEDMLSSYCVRKFT